MSMSNESQPKYTAQEISLCALKLDMYWEEERLAGGTAFFYELDSRLFLVTNWHNVTGRNPDTGKPIRDDAGLPDRVAVGIPGVTSEGGIEFFEVAKMLYSDEDRLRATWWEHPSHLQRVDLAVIPFGSRLDFHTELNTRVVAVSDQVVSTPEVGASAGQDVFTLGFPRLIDGGGLGIWKRGSIATEPSFDLDKLPKIFIDSATREGMSGSPVFVRGLVSVRVPGRQVSGLAFKHRFLGVYSGRVGDDTFLAQLGVVWKESAIIETIKARKLGQSPF